MLFIKNGHSELKWSHFLAPGRLLLTESMKYKELFWSACVSHADWNINDAEDELLNFYFFHCWESNPGIGKRSSTDGHSQPKIKLFLIFISRPRVGVMLFTMCWFHVIIYEMSTFTEVAWKVLHAPKVLFSDVKVYPIAFKTGSQHRWISIFMGHFQLQSITH